MADSMASLFSPTPFKSTKSSIPRSGLEAISKATTLQDENPFDSITGPLRKRKRRKVAEELQASGVEVGSPEYFETFRDKLIEFGDAEGAQIVETKRQENINQEIARRKAEADIVNVESTVESRDRGADRDDEIFNFEKVTTQQELDQVERRIDIAAQNANTQEAQLTIQRARVGLERRRVQLDEMNNPANLAGKLATTEGQRLKNEQQRLTNEILGDTGALPGRASDDSDGGSAFADAQRTVNSIREIITEGDSFGSIAGPGGLLKRKLGGLARMAGIPVSTKSEALEAMLQVLQAKIGPELLEDTRLSNQERARIESIVGSLDGFTDEVSINGKMDQIENVLLDSRKRRGLGPLGEETTTPTVPSIGTERKDALSAKYKGLASQQGRNN